MTLQNRASLSPRNKGCNMWLDALQAGTKALLAYATDDALVLMRLAVTTTWHP